MVDKVMVKCVTCFYVSIQFKNGIVVVIDDDDSAAKTETFGALYYYPNSHPEMTALNVSWLD